MNEKAIKVAYIFRRSTSGFLNRKHSEFMALFKICLEWIYVLKRFATNGDDGTEKDKKNVPDGIYTEVKRYVLVVKLSEGRRKPSWDTWREAGYDKICE